MSRTLALVAGFAVIAAGLTTGNPALAVKPSFDCSKSDGSAMDAVCADDSLAELDLELARLYELALTGPHMTPDQEKELKAMQRGWLKGRDECWKSSLGLETCVADSYAMRIHELRQGYADARSDDANGISIGPVAVACEGFDAGISAVFVNTSKPLVSLMWMDNAIVLPQVMSGSGARYESDKWEGGTSTFWNKGKDVMFNPPGQAEMNCVVEEIG